MVVEVDDSKEKDVADADGDDSDLSNNSDDDSTEGIQF